MYIIKYIVIIYIYIHIIIIYICIIIYIYIYIYLPGIYIRFFMHMPKRREQILQGMPFKQLVDVLSIFARAGGPMDVRRLGPIDDEYPFHGC